MHPVAFYCTAAVGSLLLLVIVGLDRSSRGRCVDALCASVAVSL